MGKKHVKKRCIDPATKYALIFFLLFVIAVAILIPVMARYSQRRLEENIARAEAEHQYRMDLSWIDSPFDLTWLAEQNQYDLDAENAWEAASDSTLLRTCDFTNGSFSDIFIDSRDVYSSPELVPSDDPRGYVLAAGNRKVWSVYRVDENEKIVRLFRTADMEIADIVGFYGGKLYCHVYESEDKPYSYDKHLCSWNCETGDMFHYRGNAIGLSTDGKAAMLIRRDTGLFETYAGLDANGKVVELERPIQGWTLGIEDAQGKWQPVCRIGLDGAFRDVACAAWLDTDRLLFAARQAGKPDPYGLYIYTLSRNEFEPCLTANGEAIYLYDEPISFSMAASSDGAYVAYRVWDGYQGGSPAQLMVQSLATGRVAQICPRDAVIDENMETIVHPYDTSYTQVWTQ